MNKFEHETERLQVRKFDELKFIGLSFEIIILQEVLMEATGLACLNTLLL